MTIVMTILGIILALDALILTVLVLMQQGRSAGLSGAIAGGAETFFGKKKAESYEGKLLLFTKITGAIFIALAVIMLFLQKYM